MNTGKRKTYLYGAVLAVAFFFLFMSLGMHYLGSTDFSYVLRWWLMLLLLGIAFQPLTMIIFRNMRDGGWLFAKTLGIAAAGWLMWLMSSVKILKFSRFNCVLMVVIVFGINMLLYYLLDLRKSRRFSLRKFYTDERICAILGVETIFFCAFVFWCYLKGISPDAYGTERFMDYGFMISMFKSDYMPPSDMWLSGYSINYYYVGQYLMTYLTKLAGVPVTHGYNIAMMMLAGMGFALSYSLGNNLMNLYLSYRRKTKYSPAEMQRLAELGCVTTEKDPPFFRPLFAGTLSAIAVAVAGNMHYPFYKFIYPKLQRLWGVQDSEMYSKYWFPDATRYIGYRPDVPDKTIHEFPVYSYAIGDLHAHVIDTLFVLTVLALMIAWLTHRRKAMDIVREYNRRPKMPELLSEVFRPELVLCAFLIGIFFMTNAWDYPIYIVVCGAVILFSNLIVYRYKARAWILTAYQGAMFVVISLLVSLPFTLTFDSISTGIGLNDSTHHTSQFQLMILWGLPFLCLCTFIGLRISAYLDECKVKAKAGKVLLPKALESEVLPDFDEEAVEEFSKKSSAKEKAQSEILEKPGFLARVWESFWAAMDAVGNALGRFFSYIGRSLAKFMDSLETTDLFVLVIGLCAFGLVLLPEILYVVDIYGGAYQRANTMFKLTYQAFIMYGLSLGYIIVRFVTMPTSRFMKGAGIVFLCLLISEAGYFNEMYTTWFSGYYQGLDATTFIRDDCSDADAEMIDYINENFDKKVNVLEMCGLSYTYFNRVSAFTGMPTVLGWQTHEWLWRSSGQGNYPKIVSDRRSDVNSIYSSSDVNQIAYLLEQYDVDYIMIGTCERVDGYNDNPGKDEDAITVQGKKCRKINLQTDTLIGLGVIKHQATDSRTKEKVYLIEVNRDKTEEIAKQYIVKVSDKEYLIDGCASPRHIKDTLGFTMIPEEYRTVADYFRTVMGGNPHEGCTIANKMDRKEDGTVEYTMYEAVEYDASGATRVRIVLP
ncbi:MAG: hypothetical protein J6Y20_14820 [Lachnospiraceae bacterium]|nr:hypothetical protein [Lachnospiraceae bacterium]